MSDDKLLQPSPQGGEGAVSGAAFHLQLSEGWMSPHSHNFETNLLEKSRVEPVGLDLNNVPKWFSKKNHEHFKLDTQTSAHFMSPPLQGLVSFDQRYSGERKSPVSILGKEKYPRSVESCNKNSVGVQSSVNQDHDTLLGNQVPLQSPLCEIRRLELTHREGQMPQVNSARLQTQLDSAHFKDKMIVKTQPAADCSSSHHATCSNTPRSTPKKQCFPAMFATYFAEYFSRKRLLEPSSDNIIVIGDVPDKEVTHHDCDREALLLEVMKAGVNDQVSSDTTPTIVEQSYDNRVTSNEVMKQTETLDDDTNRHMSASDDEQPPIREYDTNELITTRLRKRVSKKENLMKQDSGLRPDVNTDVNGNRKRTFSPVSQKTSRGPKLASISVVPMSLRKKQNSELNIIDNNYSINETQAPLEEANNFLGRFGITSEGVRLLPVLLHFHKQYCKRMRSFINKLKGQPPHCEITNKFDRAGSIPGLSGLERGVWSRYAEESIDLVRDASAHFLESKHNNQIISPTSSVQFRVTVQEQNTPNLNLDMNMSPSKTNKWVVYVETHTEKMKVGEARSQVDTNRLIEQAYHSMASIQNMKNENNQVASPKKENDSLKSEHCSAFIDPKTGVYMEEQTAAYCSIHAMNAMFGSVQLGCSPQILHAVEKTIHQLERSPSSQINDGFMDQQTVVSLGRNLGVYLISIALDYESISTLSCPAHLYSKGVDSFVRHLIKVQRFIIGRPSARNAEGHFVCVQVVERTLKNDISSNRPRKKIKVSKNMSSESKVLEWLLVDSMQKQAVSFSSLGALLKSFIGNKHGDVPPFLITPVVYSERSLAVLSEVMSSMGSLLDLATRMFSKRSGGNHDDASKDFSDDDEVSLMMMIAERNSAPAHSLTLSMVISLLSGERSMDDFGLSYQIKSDFRDRVTCGNCSAVQRFVEGPNAPEMLAELPPVDYDSALVLTVLSRMINDSDLVNHVVRQFLCSQGFEAMNLSTLSSKSTQQLKQQASSIVWQVLQEQQPCFDIKLSSTQKETILQDVERRVGCYFEAERRVRKKTKRGSRSV